MNRIAQIRRSRGLSQADLAHMVKVEQPTISRIERGSTGVTLKVLVEIASALKVEVSDLFSDRSELEQTLLEAFRGLSPDRQAGWIDMAKATMDPDRRNAPIDGSGQRD